MSIERYSTIDKKNPREMLLLKSKPCQWGICTFCDYTLDNTHNDSVIHEMNKTALARVTGIYGQLEIINSGSCMELPDETLTGINDVVKAKAIRKLYFEAHYRYRDKLDDFRKRFEIPVVFKTGIETFDETFRNQVLKKGVIFDHPSEVAQYFESICLLVGIKGQTREMIERDVEILLKYFKHGCINVYQNNTTEIKADERLIEWFGAQFRSLNDLPNVDVLWHNTDYGVGGNVNE